MLKVLCPAPSPWNNRPPPATVLWVDADFGFTRHALDLMRKRIATRSRLFSTSGGVTSKGFFTQGDFKPRAI